MTRFNISILFSLFIIIISSTVGFAADKGETSKERLAKIEKYMRVVRREKGNEYRYRAAELKSRRDNAMRLLDVADEVESLSLMEQAEIAQNVLELNGYAGRPYGKKNEWKVREPGKYYIIEPESAAELYVRYQTLVAEAKNDVGRKYESGAATLEKNREYDLDVTLPRLEAKLREKVTVSVARGVVSGIVCSADKNTAIVDGKIVGEGDVLGKVKVVSIEPGSVEFERGGVHWAQKAGTAGGGYWD